MNALIIDDSPIFQRILEHTLRDMGFDTQVVDTVAAGILALREKTFDLLIVDLHLPDQDGLEFCRQLRSRGAHRMLPVLMLTADEDPLLLQRALDAGVTELFFKKNIEALNTSLREYIARLRRRHKGRVLLVEDSPTTATLLRYMLSKMTLEVDLCDTAEAALELICHGAYDLVVCDIMLAGQVTGLGLVRAVRMLDGDASRVPILGLSAMEDAARKIEMLRMGANDYVAKPVLEEEFIARVGNLIESKQLMDEVQRQRQELRERSIRDPLTGLYNRHFLTEISTQLFSRADRNRSPISLLMIDLDHFKSINDTNGHSVGDRVLAEVGKLLAHSCRKSDVTARFGGEEFIVLLPDTDGEAARQWAERFRTVVRGLNPANIQVTASIGIGVQPAERAIGFDKLFRIADHALYEAKASGRDQTVMGREAAALRQ